MLDYDRLGLDLSGCAADDWVSTLVGVSRDNLNDSKHGKLAGWRALLESLPDVGKHRFDLTTPSVTARFDWPGQTMNQVRQSLLQLAPWRKGPFDIAGIRIDTEWRSDLKWDRLGKSISPLTERRILDVGCGNGYYALRMRGAGARLVLGIDPTILFVAQFAAIQHFMRAEPVHVLPLRLHELPEPPALFDTTFSMGVLYHQREPLQHLHQLKQTLRRDGELVLETLIVPGDASAVVVPEDRYARMRNVWHLPTRQRLTEWLAESGFTDIRTIDQTFTTTDEQRATEWMPFESLAEALDPADSRKTIEGLPAPLRMTVVCRNT
jgi:tRNA (mo5U34)-methyltransferase